MTEVLLTAERNVLCAALIAPKTIDDWTIQPEDFGHPKHQEVARSLRLLSAAMQPIDPLAVADDVARRGITAVTLTDVTDLMGATGVCESGPVRFYCGLILDASIERFLRWESSSVASDLGEGRIGAQEAIARIQQVSGRALERLLRTDRFAVVPEWAKGLWAELEQRTQAERTNGIPTGFAALDEHVGGMRPGVVTVLGGRTSSGKSAFARSIADNASKGGCGVHYFTLEDSALMLVERQVADMARVDLGALASPKGQVTQGDMARLAMAANNLRLRVNWGIEDQPTMSSGSIAASVRRRKAELGTRLVVVDYVQLIREKGESPRERINTALLGLLKLAREENVAVLLLSQVGRDQEKESRPPRLSDLKESGAIEEQASCVLLLHREKDDEKTGRPGRAGVIVAKNKHGARDVWVDLAWDGPTATYRAKRMVGGHAL